MPIYKLSTSNHSAIVRHNYQPPPIVAVSVGEKANGDAVLIRGHDEDNLYTQRPSPAEREVDFDPKKTSTFNRKESIIEREIREQLRRESELAALRGLPTLVRTSLDQVDQNEDHHRTPDTSWNYHEVQMLPPEQQRSSSREERKLTVIRSPGGVTSSTTTTTTTTITTTSSVNGSKPGKVEYQYSRGGHDMVDQKGREEKEDDGRGQWKKLGIDFEVENVENGRKIVWKSQEITGKNEDVFDSGVIDRKVEKTEKETPQEQRHSFRESWSPAGDVQRNLHRVHPFEEVDSIQSELFAQYVPQNEKPIERDIRRASEREDALRAARGLASLSARDSEGAEAGIEVRPPRMVEGGGGGGGGGDQSTQENHAMKKFAESRLRAELEREKRREMDLLREGKIKLLSEQRVPEFLGPSSSRNKISSETEELREFSAKRRSLGGHVDFEWDVIASGAERRNADAAAAENRTASSANPRLSYGGGKGATVAWSDARTAKNVNGRGDGGMRNHSVAEAEQRIEAEIIELRKRESELREQRRSRNSDIPIEAGAAQPEAVEEHDGAHAQAAKPEVVVAPTSSEAARRRHPEPRFDRDLDSVDLGRSSRLALIDQWERGIIQGGGITT